MLRKCDILLISVNSPIILGIYENELLIKEYIKEGKTSDVLPSLFEEILRDYKIDKIFYTNGPGNFSSLKLTNIFLQTLCIIQDINLFCTSSFSFTKDKFINAYGKIHFLKENDVIKTIQLDDKINTTFELPNKLDSSIFNDSCFPLYILPAL